MSERMLAVCLALTLLPMGAQAQIIARDRCPDDPNKLAPGICGCGIPDDDSDGDGVADCL